MTTLEEVLDLAATVEGVTGEVGPDGTTTWSGPRGPFAALTANGGQASFRLDRELAAAALALGATPLSAREADVLRAAADGSTVAGIAARLFLSEGTVRNYLSSAIGKTGARTRVEAARVAEEKGWL